MSVLSHTGQSTKFDFLPLRQEEKACAYVGNMLEAQNWVYGTVVLEVTKNAKCSIGILPVCELKGQ